MGSCLERLQLSIEGHPSVAALALEPERALACYVFAHGAGAGMEHHFMCDVADGLADRQIASFRFQFPYMERGSRRPDGPATAHRAVGAAVACAATRFAGLPLFAGGKSFGGRMTSQAEAARLLPGVKGLIFLGFPLHQPDQPSGTRADHLGEVHVPMLFVQGTRDKLAKIDLLRVVVAGLGQRATLVEIEEADHSFHVPARSGRTDADARRQALDAILDWIVSLG